MDICVCVMRIINTTQPLFATNNNHRVQAKEDKMVMKRAAPNNFTTVLKIKILCVYYYNSFFVPQFPMAFLYLLNAHFFSLDSLKNSRLKKFKCIEAALTKLWLFLDNLIKKL